MGKTTQQIWFGWERPWIVAIVQSGKCPTQFAFTVWLIKLYFSCVLSKTFFGLLTLFSIKPAPRYIYPVTCVSCSAFTFQHHLVVIDIEIFWGQSQVENNIACQTILKQRMKEGLLHDCPVESDVREFCADAVACDGVCAGFPCQAGVLSLI